jgi:hypothetical protein
MRTRFCKLKFFPLLIFSTFVLVFYNITYSIIVHNVYTNERTNNVQNTILHSHPTKLKSTRKLISLQWTFNMNISHFSSIISGDYDQDVLVESLIFSDFWQDRASLAENLRCYFKMGSRKQDAWMEKVSELLEIQLMTINEYPKSLWKVSCLVKKTMHRNKFLKLELAIIDHSYFEYYMSMFNRNDLLITWRTPQYLNTSIPRKKQVVNCVHMLRIADPLGLERLVNWIELQRNLGYSKLIFYVYNINDLYLMRLKQLNHDDFIDLIDYRLDFDTLCRGPIEMLSLKIETEAEKRLAQHLYDSCLNAFKKHFTFTSHLIHNSHERLNGNDCLMRSKYSIFFKVHISDCEFSSSSKQSQVLLLD